LSFGLFALAACCLVSVWPWPMDWDHARV
jgi:hypothetical protein